jgi:hypothetical protein
MMVLWDETPAPKAAQAPVVTKKPAKRVVALTGAQRNGCLLDIDEEAARA